MCLIRIFTPLRANGTPLRFKNNLLLSPLRYKVYFQSAFCALVPILTVIAQDDSSLLFLPPDKILETCYNVCASHSILIMNMLKILSNRALMLNKKIEYLSAKSIRSKVSNYLLDISRVNGGIIFKIPMKRHELADYLNMPRPSFSREMGLMRDEGIIEFDGSLIKIKNILIL
jgi:CRP-like cAMP-binding protein